MIKKILIAVVALILVLVAVISTRPSTLHIERSAQIAAPPEVVLAQISDFHRWVAWSPWEKLDPSMKKTFEGPAQGVGAKYAWEGNDKVGKGRMTITDIKPDRVGIHLEFMAPYSATNETTFSTKPDAGGVKLTWAMDGTNNFMMKAFGMFMNMDSMVGHDFETGLASLKNVSETESKKIAAELEAKRAAEAAAAAQKLAAEAAAAESAQQAAAAAQAGKKTTHKKH